MPPDPDSPATGYLWIAFLLTAGCLLLGASVILAVMAPGPNKALSLVPLAGIVGLIVIQALVNMGGVVGLLPITGVPLPLVSAGGSSLCICMGCIGILLNIATQSKDGRARQ